MPSEEWDNFVQHNWLPVLSLALGADWRSQYETELAGIVALQQSLQPSPQALAAPTIPQLLNRPQPIPVPAPTTNNAGALPKPAVPPVKSSPVQATKAAPPPPVPNAALPPPGPVPSVAGEGYAARAFTVEAVDIDGKRRRLRRKRAASPDTYLQPGGDTEGAGGQAKLSTAGQAHGKSGGSSGAHPPQASAAGVASPPSARSPASVASSAANSADTPVEGDGAVSESKHSPVTHRLIRQMSKVSLDGSAPSPSTGAMPPLPRPAHAHAGAASDSSGPPIRLGSLPSSEVRAKAPAPPADGGTAIDGADGLNLVQDISRRICANMVEMESTRNVSLPPHLAAIAVSASEITPADSSGPAASAAMIARLQLQQLQQKQAVAAFQQVMGF
jgi:hypothetical protein